MSKKLSPKKLSPKKLSPKKLSPKKLSPKKLSPKKSSPKKLSPTTWLRKMEEGNKKSILRKKEIGGRIKTDSFIEKTELLYQEHHYFTMVNGGYTFNVSIKNNTIFVLAIDCKKEDIYFNPNIYNIPLFKLDNYLGYWYGYDTGFSKQHGNSILIKKPTQYIYIGDVVYSFSTKSPIIDYISPVGNSDVPYPIAYDKYNIYFMLDKVYVSRKLFTTKINLANAEKIYGEFYDKFYHGQKGSHKMENLYIDYDIRC